MTKSDKVEKDSHPRTDNTWFPLSQLRCGGSHVPPKLALGLYFGTTAVLHSIVVMSPGL